jgi:hypothetical protein
MFAAADDAPTGEAFGLPHPPKSLRLDRAMGLRKNFPKSIDTYLANLWEKSNS